MVRFSQRRMRSNSARARIRTKIKKIWLMIITFRNVREIYNLGEVLCHSKLLSKQTCNISGMGMTTPLGVMGIVVTKYLDISRGLENKYLVYIG